MPTEEDYIEAGAILLAWAGEAALRFSVKKSREGSLRRGIKLGVKMDKSFEKYGEQVKAEIRRSFKEMASSIETRRMLQEQSGVRP